MSLDDLQAPTNEQKKKLKSVPVDSSRVYTDIHKAPYKVTPEMLNEARKKLKSAPVDSSRVYTDIHKAPYKVTPEMLNEARKKLKSVPVYFANTNLKLNSKYIPYHGFLVTGTPGVKSSRVYRRLYTDINKAPYKVTPEILSEAGKLGISLKTLFALRQLVGKEYSAVEYFHRALLQEIAYIEHKTLTDEEIQLKLCEPDSDIKKLIALNPKINHEIGGYAPLSVNANSAQTDLNRFINHKTVHRKVPVSITTVQDILREQALYHFYIDEKLGIGKALLESEKQEALKKLTQNDINKLTSKWVKHKHIPKGKLEANCNKSISSILQFCINREQGKRSDTYQKVQTATFFSVASKDRMHLHDPLLINNFLGELSTYRDIRNANGVSLLERMGLTRMTKEIKISAADKLRDLITRKKSDIFEPLELKALREGKLGKFVHRLELAGKLPIEIIRQEEALITTKKMKI